MSKINWDEYTARHTGSTMTDVSLLLGAAYGNVLDVGCGTGRNTARLDHVTRRVGVDPGFAGLRRGRSLFPELGLVCGNAYQLPIQSSAFDSVMMIDVVEHLEKPEVALKEVIRVLKDNGVLFLQTPNYPIKRIYDWWHYARGRRNRFQDDPTHVTKFNYSRLKSLVAASGFKIDRAVARNIFLDSRLPLFRRLRDTRIGLILAQKVIVIARNVTEARNRYD